VSLDGGYAMTEITGSREVASHNRQARWFRCSRYTSANEQRYTARPADRAHRPHHRPADDRRPASPIRPNLVLSRDRWPSGTSSDSEDTLAFSVLAEVRPMIET